MSVQSDISRIQYTGNGSTVTPYPIPFVFNDSEHIRAVRIAEDGTITELTLGIDFYVVGAGSVNGGALTTREAVPGTQGVSIYREVPIVQQTKFIENDPFPASVVERTVDSLTMVCQQLARKLTRTFRIPDFANPLDSVTMAKTGENSVMVMGEDGAFHLWSMKKLKEEINAMAAVPPMMSALQVLYPVGCLYYTRRLENPRDILGFGTWQRFGSGRMIVALDPDNPALSAVDMEGGASEVSLAGDQNGPHRHHVSPAEALETALSGQHQHETQEVEVTTSAGGSHYHNYTGYRNQDGAGRTPMMIIDDGRTSAAITRATNTDGEHAHTFTMPSILTKTGGAHRHIFDLPEHYTDEAGLGAPHNNMPPYVVVNVWTRILVDAPEEGVGTLPFPADPLFIDRVTGEVRRLVVDDSVIGTVPAGDDLT